MTMTKVDPECSRYSQSWRTRYFDSVPIPSFYCSENHRRAVKFGIFGVLQLFFYFSSEILHKNVTGRCRNSSATVWYILMYSWTSGLSLRSQLTGKTFHVFLTGLSYSIFALILSW